MEIPPNQTLYIQGLNDKISKIDLKKSLYFLFSPFGTILDIVALKTLPARGQAFVVYDDIQDATIAMRALNGFPMFEMGLKISYAKSKSNVVKIKDGTLLKRDVVAEKRLLDTADAGEPESRKKARLDDDEDQSHNILFLKNLPSDVTEEKLINLFNKYQGFKEVRVIPGKKEIAFVEYETLAHARAAKNVLHNFQMAPGHAIQVLFAEK